MELAQVSRDPQPAEAGNLLLLPPIVSASTAAPLQPVHVPAIIPFKRAAQVKKLKVNTVVTISKGPHQNAVGLITKVLSSAGKGSAKVFHVNVCHDGAVVEVVLSDRELTNAAAGTNLPAQLAPGNVPTATTDAITGAVVDSYDAAESSCGG